MINTLTEKIFSNCQINKDEAVSLIESDLSKLCSAADKIRAYFCKNSFDICSIINGKSGRCSENCKYCAQSSHYKTSIQEYPLLDTNTILKQAVENNNKGVLRFSIVTSGKRLTDEEVDNICNTYKTIKTLTNISLCSSNGLLSYQQLVKLKQSGVTRYHCNIETSRKNFENICTTHTYEDKINTIKAAQKAGLQVCSGCIIGMGETMEDRIDMMLDLRSLKVESVPVNILNPIKETPFEKLPLLTQDEVLRSIAIFRFILPNSTLRLAGGRSLFKDNGKQVFLSGANALISGNMLTTHGICIEDDIKTISDLGFKIEKI